MRVLFTSTAGLGHLYPLLPLARAARDARHQVLFAVPGAACGVVRRQGFAAVGVSDGESPREAGEFWSQLPMQAQPNTYVFAGLFGRMRTEAALHRTGQIVDQFSPDLVVSECMEFAGSLVAEARGIPQVAVGIGPLGLPDVSTGPLMDELNRFRSGLRLPAAGRPPWEVQRFATWVPDLLQHASFDDMGPVTKYRYEDAEPALEAGPLVGERSTVYATLGSAAAGQAGSITIYRAVLEALADCDADVLFSVGSLDPAMLGSVPANVTVTGYARQGDAMRRDVVISHGGCGTTVAALFHGRPAWLSRCSRTSRTTHSD